MKPTPAHPPSDADAASVGEQRRRAAAAIEAMPEQDRHILLLAKADGLTDFEIAEVLRLPPNTVSASRRAACRLIEQAVGPRHSPRRP